MTCRTVDEEEEFLEDGSETLQAEHASAPSAETAPLSASHMAPSTQTDDTWVTSFFGNVAAAVVAVVESAFEDGSADRLKTLKDKVSKMRQAHDDMQNEVLQLQNELRILQEQQQDLLTMLEELDPPHHGKHHKMASI
jgi:uncharacterized protein YlxW (UPF0749 family)